MALRPHVRCRVIVDNDYSGDPDGLVALAHHLLSPANRVVGVTSSFLNPRFPGPNQRAEDGADVARELIEVIGGSTRPPVAAGCENPFDEHSRSAASELIVEEARREDELPLYLVCGGPLTNVATALRDAPDIAARMTLVWIGGSLEPGAFEYNRDTDLPAAEFVLSRPGLDVHQFPLETYRRCAYAVSELEHDVGGAGRLARWLWARYQSPPDWVQIGEVWPLGDSPPLLITALTSTWATAQPTAGGGTLTTHTDIDFRLVVADMLAKLRLHEARRAETSEDQR